MLKQYFIILTVGLSLAFAAAAPAETSALDAVRTSVQTIIDILKNGRMNKAAKRSAMQLEIGKRFDFKTMSQHTLVTNWKTASTEETVEYRAEKTRGKKALVETLIKTASADIPVNYKPYQKDGAWLVYDVVIEGVSLVSNYRSSYHTIVKKEGLDGLMLKMEEKLKELEAG